MKVTVAQLGLVLLPLFLVACTDEGKPAGPIGDAGPNGCHSYRDMLIGQPGDDIGGHTYTTFADPFFRRYCTRCHESTRTGADRNGAPATVNLDIEASVRDNLVRIRNVVGESNIMPFDNPNILTCEQRRTIVEWIDVGAP